MSTTADDARTVSGRFPGAGPVGLADVWRSAGRNVRNLADLAASEAELAALSALAMLLLTILSAAAIVIGWSLLMVVAIALLNDVGVSWRLSAAVAALLHGVVAFVCWEYLARLSRNLTMPALRHAVTPRGEAGTPRGEAGQSKPGQTRPGQTRQ